MARFDTAQNLHRFRFELSALVLCDSSSGFYRFEERNIHRSPERGLRQMQSLIESYNYANWPPSRTKGHGKGVPFKHYSRPVAHYWRGKLARLDSVLRTTEWCAKRRKYRIRSYSEYYCIVCNLTQRFQRWRAVDGMLSSTHTELPLLHAFYTCNEEAVVSLTKSDSRQNTKAKARSRVQTTRSIQLLVIAGSTVSRYRRHSDMPNIMINFNIWCFLRVI